MAVSKAQQMAKDKYRQEKRDQITAEVPKGKRDAYKLAAREFGISLALLIQSGVEEYIQNHAGEDFSRKITPPAEKISSADKKIIDTVNSLPPESKKALLKFLDTLVSEIKPRD